MTEPAPAWGVLVAMREGEPLPPIEVWAWHGEYYVLDGHHRVAAARALGSDYIALMSLKWTETRVGRRTDAKPLSRVDRASDAVRHPSAIEGNTRKPSPDVEYPDGGCWVLSTQPFARRWPISTTPRGVGGHRSRARRRGLCAQEPSDPAEPVAVPAPSCSSSAVTPGHGSGAAVSCVRRRACPPAPPHGQARGRPSNRRCPGCF